MGGTSSKNTTCEAPQHWPPSPDAILESRAHSLEAKPSRPPIFGRVLGPAIRSKRLQGIRALVIFSFFHAPGAFMRVSAKLAHNL